MEDILARVNASKPLVITVCRNLDQVLALLRSNPMVQTITVKDQEISIHFSGDQEEEAGLLAQLIGAGVMVSSFVREPGSLESVFMQLTDQEEERSVLSYEAESGV